MPVMVEMSTVARAPRIGSLIVLIVRESAMASQRMCTAAGPATLHQYRSSMLPPVPTACAKSPEVKVLRSVSSKMGPQRNISSSSRLEVNIWVKAKLPKACSSPATSPGSRCIVPIASATKIS